MSWDERHGFRNNCVLGGSGGPNQGCVSPLGLQLHCNCTAAASFYQLSVLRSVATSFQSKVVFALTKTLKTPDYSSCAPPIDTKFEATHGCVQFQDVNMNEMPRKCP